MALARALASQPEVLLLDEPLSALDTYLREHIEQQLIERLQNYPGISLLVTHNLQAAYRLCRHLLVIDQGTILDAGNQRTIFNHPRTKRVAQLTDCKNISMAAIAGVHQIKVQQWDCHLRTHLPPPPDLAHIGIRAQHIEILTPSQPAMQPAVNTFHCWLTTSHEALHHITLNLKLHQPPTAVQDYHIQAEVPKTNWSLLQKQPFPWTVYFNPAHLILLTEERKLSTPLEP